MKAPHIQYKLKNGTLIVGVTTVINTILAKSSLIEWAYQCGLKGVDYKELRDTAGEIGTIAHYLILCDLKNQPPDLTGYKPEDIATAKICLGNYYTWKNQHTIKPIMVETPLISERFAYGGTLDLYAELDGRNTLIDFKTSKGIFDSFIIQCSAYSQLILENTGKSPDAINIVRIPKDSKESFETRYLTTYDKYFEVFRHCLCIYNIMHEKQ